MASRALPPVEDLSHRALPQRECNLWRQLLKLYEGKLYKKAIKTADQILKKCPEHGETLAMKGLSLYYMPGDRKQEAYELVRLGVRNDLKSFTCWHVYG
jgi:peptide alpha-N-acetyltransferase